MALSGYLSEYSLVEILKFIQQGRKTGLLLISPDNDSVQSVSLSSYIWCQNGRIVAHARDLSQLGLIAMIGKREWISLENLSTLSQQSKSANQPLGSYLKSVNALDAEQLHLLFHAQVLQPVCGLFKLVNAKFSFDEKPIYAYQEMTGMSMNAGEVSLLGLRVLRDWSLLKSKLPAPELGLKRLCSEQPEFKLDTQETQIWELANGNRSIAQIAEETELSLMKVQQISFRLAAVSLVKEIVLEAAMPELEKTMVVVHPPSPKAEISKPTLSKSFLSNLTSFLKKRV